MKRILLVDDREVDNYINTLICQDTGLVEIIDSCKNGKDAIDYLSTKGDDDNYPKPDIIFLDINMPIMNGWEFLEAYDQLDKDKQGGKVIIMLTTSLNPDDIARAKQYTSLDEFRSKPMTKEMFIDIIEKYESSLV
ncbi:response regulator [Sediminitomix flava]|uniref:response regulator n=1 Tax=Sediminitomix flava TaxID=379075 RepID=UPI0037446093